MPRSAAKRDDFGHVLRRHYRPRRVRRRIQNDQFRPRRDQARNHVGSNPESRSFVTLQQNAIAAGVTHNVLERNPVRHRKDDLVPVIDQHLDGIEQHVLAADRGHCLLALVARAEVFAMALQDRVLQLHRAADGGIAGEVAVDGGNGGIFNVLRSRKVRLAHAHVNHVDARLPQLVGFGDHGHSGRGLNAVDTLCNFQCCRNCGDGAHALPAFFRV